MAFCSAFWFGITTEVVLIAFLEILEILVP